MLGGVAFDMRQHDPPQAAAGENRTFPLYADQSSSSEDVYTFKRYYRMYFDESVRGLKPGAPVEIKGIQVGEVVSVELQYDLTKADFQVPVLMVIEPERLSSFVSRGGEVVSNLKTSVRFETSNDSSRIDRVNQLIARGMRAQLKTGNMLTGQLFVDLDFYPEAKPAQLGREGEYLVFPTLPAPLPVAQRVDTILNMIQQIPFDKIGQDLHETIAGASATLKEIRGLTEQVNESSIPKLNAALDSLQKSMKGLQSLIGTGSPLSYNVEQIASELALAVRSLHSLLATLERDPQVLLLGKEDEER
ncbi:MAG: hypothetical protein C0614_02580 [Desulfuromonas sp.]|nr:MAG: hypothetical protein C0614_02580 [Desulfuromonas sp.]